MSRVIISGGGTGGHVFPAIAIADALMQSAPATEILFVGAHGKLEMDRVPKAGYKMEGLNITGFQRKLSLKNLAFPFKLAGSMARALWIVRKFRPDVAVGVGGYASGPVLRIAGWLGVPTVLQEQNSYAGVTNRILAARASLVCVAYQGMEKFFPKHKLLFTGNPVRKDILENRINKSDALETLRLDQNKKTVLIFGGSLGAGTINAAVRKNADLLMSANDINLIWQVGKAYYDEYKTCSLAGRSDVLILPFIENMDVAYSAADVVVCRAGALTISELSVLGKAAILIPSPNVAEDHQTANARSLTDKKAALMIRDDEAGDKLVTMVRWLLDEPRHIMELEENIGFFARPHAATQIAAEILKLCKTEQP